MDQTPGRVTGEGWTSGPNKKRTRKHSLYTETDHLGESNPDTGHGGGSSLTMGHGGGLEP